MSLPIGRTKHQPITWRCLNPECAAGTGLRQFEFETDSPECPKCGACEPYVIAKALIHLLVRDKQGQIQGEYGIRYKVACEGKRDYLATETNQEAATGDYRAINCPGCIKALEGATVISGHSLSVAL